MDLVTFVDSALVISTPATVNYVIAVAVIGNEIIVPATTAQPVGITRGGIIGVKEVSSSEAVLLGLEGEHPQRRAEAPTL